MPHSKQAAKRLRQADRRRLANRTRMTAMKSQIKRTDAALDAGDLARAQGEMPAVMKKIDKAAKKGTIHKNTAARRKSRLARRLKALAAKGAAPAK